MSYIYMFFVRRLLFVAAMRIDIFSVKIGAVLILQVGWLYFLIDNKPFKSKTQFYFELGNEVIFYCIVCHLPLFTDYVGNPKTQVGFGWLVIYLQVALFVSNIIYLLIGSVDTCKRKLKLKKHKA